MSAPARWMMHVTGRVTTPAPMHVIAKTRVMARATMPTPARATMPTPARA